MVWIKKLTRQLHTRQQLAVNMAKVDKCPPYIRFCPCMYVHVSSHTEIIEVTTPLRIKEHTHSYIYNYTEQLQNV